MLSLQHTAGFRRSAHTNTHTHDKNKCNECYKLTESRDTQFWLACSLGKGGMLAGPSVAAVFSRVIAAESRAVVFVCSAHQTERQCAPVCVYKWACTVLIRLIKERVVCRAAAAASAAIGSDWRRSALALSVCAVLFLSHGTGTWMGRAK